MFDAKDGISNADKFKMVDMNLSIKRHKEEKTHILQSLRNIVENSSSDLKNLLEHEWNSDHFRSRSELIGWRTLQARKRNRLVQMKTDAINALRNIEP